MIKHFFRLLILLSFTQAVYSELPRDELGQVETLPFPYPDDWVIVHDLMFDHMSLGKFIVMDINGKKSTEFFKGSFNGGFMPAFTQALKKPEMYVLEHFYSRGTRGKRTDVVTIYDKRTLAPVDEIVLTGAKRAEMLVSKFIIALVDDERFLLLYNFTPATFVTVIDLEKRQVVNEIQLPTCAGIYPTGKRGFSTICSNASLMTYQLDDEGQVTDQSRIEPFFDIEQDAMFERPAIINGMGYFPTFTGNVQEIDLRGSEARLGDQWSLLSAEDKKDNWRPGGAWLAATDSTHRLYVMMHENGGEGSHDDPGGEIWVYDTDKRARVDRIQLGLPAIAFDITAGDSPAIVATNIEMNLDVYDAKTGKHINTISDFYHSWPLLVYASQ